MTAPSVIWVYGKTGYDFDTGTWDQATEPECALRVEARAALTSKGGEG